MTAKPTAIIPFSVDNLVECQHDNRRISGLSFVLAPVCDQRQVGTREGASPLARPLLDSPAPLTPNVISCKFRMLTRIYETAGVLPAMVSIRGSCPHPRPHLAIKPHHSRIATSQQHAYLIPARSGPAHPSKRS